MRLDVVTPCHRPIYLPIIAVQLRLSTKFSVRWFVVFEPSLNQSSLTGHDFGHDFRQMFHASFPDGFLTPNFEIVSWTRNPNTPSYKGTALRNEALERIKEEDNWVAFLDDDTIFTPCYESVISTAIQLNQEAEGFIFSQQDRVGFERMRVSQTVPHSITVKVKDCSPGLDGCDTGQMLFKRKLIGNIRWNNQSAADHPFYRDVVFNSGNQSKVRWLNVFGSIHNALR
jgi:hypothetical protein